MSVEIGQVLFSSPNNITVYIDDLTINYSEYGNGSEIELKNIRGYKDGKFTV